MSRFFAFGPYLGYAAAALAFLVVATCTHPAPAHASPASEDLHPLEMACYDLTEHAAVVYRAHEDGYPEALLVQALGDDTVLTPEAKAVVESYIRARYRHLEGMEITLPEFLGAAYQYCLLTLKPVTLTRGV